MSINRELIIFPGKNFPHWNNLSLPIWLKKNTKKKTTKKRKTHNYLFVLSTHWILFYFLNPLEHDGTQDTHFQSSYLAESSLPEGECPPGLGSLPKFHGF